MEEYIKYQLPKKAILPKLFCKHAVLPIPGNRYPTHSGIARIVTKELACPKLQDSGKDKNKTRRG